MKEFIVLFIVPKPRKSCFGDENIKTGHSFKSVTLQDIISCAIIFHLVLPIPESGWSLGFTC